MTYTINLTNGNVFATIPDGTVNTSSSMTLIGKNYAGYGQFLDDNFIHLLENSAFSTAPTAPLTGQLWFNTTAGTLQVYTGSSWVPLASNTSSSTQPTNPVVGALWYNSTEAQLNVWSGAAWLLVGPTSSAETGTTGAIPAVIADNVGTDHIVTELYVANTVVGFISKDSSFTPGNSIAGFTTIRPGITLSTAGNTPTFQGTATSSTQLNGLTASQFMRSDIPTACSNTVTLNSSASSAAIINAAGNGVGNIGSSTGYFNTIFANIFSGTSITAQYADVAERFASDTVYEAGTVVELGGSQEITISTEELSESVFGVISTKAAYLMNSGAGTDSTHPPIAMTGRVPVRSTGIIRKGDRLVSAGNGLARAAQAGEATAFNVIGRALADKLDSGLGTVEAIVTIK